MSQSPHEDSPLVCTAQAGELTLEGMERLHQLVRQTGVMVELVEAVSMDAVNQRST